jgi:spermidine synthase
MEPWTELAQARGPDGETLVLRRRGGVFEIRCDGWELMSNRAHHSERTLGRLGCQALRGSGAAGAPRVLIGGLGMGFTLRAALDVLPAGARVTVTEIFAEVAEWNRFPLASLAGRPLDDPRVELCHADVAARLDAAAFDAILLDVDNGPDAAILARNASLYSDAGLRRLRGALLPGGLLAVWSADRSPGFEARLTAGGLNWQRVEVAARGAADDPRHTLYLARTAAAAAPAGGVALPRPGADVQAAGGGLQTAPGAPPPTFVSPPVEGHELDENRRHPLPQRLGGPG